ncbi:taurine dioxygenase [Nocardioides phosphati]|uniref:Taurine dioxygenase n=1 Tax=Nocardioides phosphati TaxID=1867775 RepID=A0ABQ2N9F0_9ACTN|nr:TauD/TfdA family dioxygenase [Nocardioides phosphati]GGO89415.1 taurine dioxygenase [Nocardioides phosphati]
MSLDIQKITAHIGARVSGVDPSADLDAATIAELRAALLEHKAIVLDAPRLDADGQARFAGHFGDLTTAHPTVPGVDGAPNILDVDSERGTANVWHTDVTFVVNPPAISTLRSITIPPYGGETLIASTAAAYNSLPEPLKAWAEQLWAVHTNVYDYARAEEDTPRQKEYRDVFQSTVYESLHPVVRVHPETGEKGLFIGGFTRRIHGLSETESRDVIRLLQAHVTKPEHILRWSWKPGQVLVFDNRITQHYAIDNYDSQPRKLARITVAGDVPVAVDGGRSQSITGDASHYTPVPETSDAAAA